LNDFRACVDKFTTTFGEYDKVCTTTIKIWSLCQGSRPASVYASKFHQLACNIDWDEHTLVSQFYWGLQDDMKDLLLAMPNAITLMDAISAVIRCDNCLFER